MSMDKTRQTVRKLLHRFDLINAQRLGFALALQPRAETDPTLLKVWDDAERIANEEMMPQIRAEHESLYQALDSPSGDWESEIEKILDQRPIILIPPQDPMRG